MAFKRRPTPTSVPDDLGRQDRQAAPPELDPPALLTDQVSQINHIAATTGDDPQLDTLLLRLRTESACRTGGALALRPRDLNPDQMPALPAGEGSTARWQPVSHSLMTALTKHAQTRGAATDPDRQLLRYRTGKPITDHRPPLQPSAGSAEAVTCPG